MFRFLIVFSLVILALTSQARVFDPLLDPPVPAPAGAPIDGGASLLLAGGASYILRRLQKRRKARA